MTPGNETRQAILRWLEKGRFTPGARLPSARAIGRELGINNSVVSRVLNELVAGRTLSRAGNRFFFARSESTPDEASTLAFFHRGDNSLPGALRLASEYGVSLEPVAVSSMTSMARLLEDFDARGSDGALFKVGYLRANAVERITRSDYPIISCGTAASGSSVDRDIDNIVRSALKRLLLLGHREMAFVGREVDYGPPAEIAAYRSRCREEGLASSAEHILIFERDSQIRESSPNRLHQWLESAGPVTALVCQDFSTAEMVEGWLLRNDRRIPRDYSLLCLFGRDGDFAQNGKIAGYGSGSELQLRLCFEHLMREIRQVRRVGVTGPPLRLRYLPPFFKGTTLGSVEGKEGGAPLGAANGDEKQALDIPQRMSREELSQWVARSHRMRHEIPEAAAFRKLDLRAAANRNFARHRGWLGGFVLHGLDCGTIAFHGAPFEVIDEKRNGGCNCVVLRSAIARTHADASLPVEVEIPLEGRTAAGICFLHGCGYVRDGGVFARYRIVYEGGEEAVIPLNALGMRAPDSPEAAEANCQDWWPDLPLLVTPTAKPVLLPGKSGQAEVNTLYTLHWRNPEPKRKLKSLHLERVDEGSATLGLLAATLYG